MAEESTTGSALYSVGTGVIGDFSAEARKNAMDRMKVEGAERKRKQQETEKKSELAFGELSKLKNGGWRFHDEYLQEEREGVSNWLTEGFQESDGKFFSGPNGKKNRAEFNNRIAKFNNNVAYSEQVKADVEKQQALLVKGADAFTPESVSAHENYMSLGAAEQYKTEVPKLQLIDWEKNLVFALPQGMFTEQDPSSDGSNRHILKEDALDAHVDGVITRTFTEGAGDKNSDGFKKVMTALYDNDPLTIANVPPEKGSPEYLEGLKEFAKKQLKDRIIAVQPSGNIRAATAVEVDTPEAAPTRGGGGVQKFDSYFKPGTYELISDDPLEYQQSSNIDFNEGGKSLRTVNAELIFKDTGEIEARKVNTTLPKDGGFVMYGVNFSDFSSGKQDAMRKLGITGPTVDMLRITETTKKVDDGLGNVSGGEGKSTLIPITPQLRKQLAGASDMFKALEESATGFDPNAY
jgi:hypothetical protein